MLTYWLYPRKTVKMDEWLFPYISDGRRTFFYQLLKSGFGTEYRITTPTQWFFIKLMAHMNLRIALTALAVASAFSTPAFAQTSPWYLGLNAGQSKLKDVNQSDFNASGVATNNVSIDDSDSAYKLFAGYKFNKNLAVEGGWTDLGKFTFNNTTTGPAGTANATVKAEGWFVSAVGILPLNEQFSLLGKLGTINSTVKTAGSTTGGIAFVEDPNGKKSAWSAVYGVGAQYNVNKSVGLRLEWERFAGLKSVNAGKGDVDLVSVGLTVGF